MDQSKIKTQVEQQYLVIKQAETRLQELRSLCKHPQTFEGNYSYRVGAINPAIICSDCGHLIKLLDLEMGSLTTTQK